MNQSHLVASCQSERLDRYLWFREIDRIDLVNGIFQIKIEVVRIWNDFNLVFMDLTQDQEDFLDSDSVEMIWYPWLEYVNIPRKVESSNL